MDKKSIYKIWAPNGVKWSGWVRPVPFQQIGSEKNNYINKSLNIKKIAYIDKMKNDVAIIVDYPENESIEEGIGLAKLGYRPIPIFNGTNEQIGSISYVDNSIIEIGLIWGAKQISEITISQDASPVFLTDTNRMNRNKVNHLLFDNSWDVYDQDLPTGKFLLENGINKVIISTLKIQDDLKKILYKYQKSGIEILHTDGYKLPEKVVIKKPRNIDKEL